MTGDEDRRARRRYWTMALARLGGASGAVFGLVLIARGGETPAKWIGLGLTLAALWVMAVVPRALAARWKSTGAP